MILQRKLELARVSSLNALLLYPQARLYLPHLCGLRTHSQHVCTHTHTPTYSHTHTQEERPHPSQAGGSTCPPVPAPRPPQGAHPLTSPLGFSLSYVAASPWARLRGLQPRLTCVFLRLPLAPPLCAAGLRRRSAHAHAPPPFRPVARHVATRSPGPRTPQAPLSPPRPAPASNDATRSPPPDSLIFLWRFLGTTAPPAPRPEAGCQP